MSYHKETTVKVRPAVLGQTLYADLDRRLRSGELNHVWAWARQYLHYVEVLPDHSDDGWFFLRRSACGAKTWDFGRIIASIFDPVCQDCLRIKNRGSDDIQTG